MQANKSLVSFDPQPAGRTKSSWSKAYFRFLLSRDESMLLKAAPLAAMGLLPVDILSNIVPVVGELDDLGFIIAVAVIAVKTIRRVRRYR